MSFPRLALLALGLPLLGAGCAAPAVTAVSYGADGVSYAESGKTTGDHLASMVSKKDCAFFRVFRNQTVCRPRDGDKDPYKVDYTSPERMPSEDGVAYAPPLRAAPDAPATSWTAERYEAASAPAPAPAAAEPVVAATAEPAPAAAAPAPAPKATAHKASKKKAKAQHAKAKKPSPGQEASVP